MHSELTKQSFSCDCDQYEILLEITFTNITSNVFSITIANIVFIIE